MKPMTASVSWLVAVSPAPTFFSPGAPGKALTHPAVEPEPERQSRKFNIALHGTLRYKAA
jgi:hypothetical protein